MRDFDSIDLYTLAAVVGGQNSDKLQIGAQGTVPKLGPVNLGVNAERSRSDYAYCVGTVSGMKGAKPGDVIQTCGLPPPPAPTGSAQ